MPTLLYVCIGLVALIFIIFIVWRLASRRASLPCPAWLAWMVELDNPFAPHYQGRSTVLQLASAVGLLPKEFSGNWLAFTQNLEKPKEEKASGTN